MHIKLFEIEDWEREIFKELEKEHHIDYVSQSLDAENASNYNQAEIISTFIYSKIDRNVLEKLPNLKLIATRSTGVDHIDLDYCNNHGIIVSNVPSYGENTVAEHVFALLLAISHRLIESVDRTCKGDFTSEDLRGFDLRGKTMGVIGTGDIGRHVIKIANGFDLNVIASDPKADTDLARDLGFEYMEMHELLSQSDIITLHVPGTDATHHLISTDEFNSMKDGAVLINTARGTIVDIHALLRALADGKLSAAGLDVLPAEPVIREDSELLHAVYSKQHDLSKLLADHVLLRMRNVIITPHNAFDTREAVQRILNSTYNNIEAFVSNSQTLNAINADKVKH